jgi:hypothetical protein
VSNHITTNILVSDSGHTLNARIGITVRNLIHFEDGLVQPSSITLEITPEGALELIRQLEQAVRLDDKVQLGSAETYVIQHEQITVDGITYGDYFHYLDGNPIAE